MKNTIVKSFIGTVAVLLLCVVAFAQKPSRIDFAKEGSRSLVWEETVAAGKSKSFVFYAKKGQQLSLGFIDDTNEGSMDLGKVSIEPNSDEPFEMEIEVTKDYIFSVSNNSNKPTSFRIFITLENAKSSPKTSTGSSNNANLSNTKEEVRFAPGKIDAYLKRTINANGSIEFTFHAKKGQLLTYSVNYDINSKGLNSEDLQVSFMDPDSTEFSDSGFADEPNDYEIKTSGIHRVKVTNKTGKKISFEFGIAITNR